MQNPKITLPRLCIYFVVMTLAFMAFFYMAFAAADKQEAGELNAILVECDDPVYFDSNMGFCINAIAKKIKQQKRTFAETARLTTNPKP